MKNVQPKWLAFSSLLLLALAIVAAIRLRGSEPTLSDSNSIDLYELAKKIRPLIDPIGRIRAGDWLARHEEPGQTFAEYANSRHVKITDERGVLYVLPLGSFDEHQQKVVDLSAEFLKLYYACEVKVLPTQDLSVIPESARRVHPSWGMRQINSRYVLYDVLPPLLPDDAVALIAFSSIDLYPQDDWNFVFGQASLHGRVGVWSIFRNGDPKTELKRVLTRTLKTATHETGHMFSMNHCTAYDCNMCGSNSQSESDRRPLHFCSECVPKIWLATGCDPTTRYKDLLEFCKRNNLKKQAEFYENAIDAITDR